MAPRSSNRRTVTIVLLALGALVLLPALVVGFGMLGIGMMGYGGMMGGMWGGGMGSTTAVPGWAYLLWMFARILLLVVVIGAGYLLYRGLVGDESEDDAALEELRLAYARGDLSDDEYERRRETLRRES